MKNSKNLNTKRIEILQLSKSVVIDNGWNELLFTKIALAKKIKHTDLKILFPNGYLDLLKLSFKDLNHKLEKKCKKNNFLRLPIHKRVRKILLTKLLIMKDDKIFYKKSFFYLFIPGNFKFLLKQFYNSIDLIWYLASDDSTDFNYYTKRITLGALYISTILHFFNNNNFIKTEEKLDENLLKISKIPKIKNKAKSITNNLSLFFKILKNI